MSYCCGRLAEKVEDGQVEYDTNADSWDVNGCCGGGCFVLVDLKYCPFCGQKLEAQSDNALPTA